ncbi:uncharacterized protein LOC141674032 [Apium graveolens]|uniref:uncharacterized protein LOC141674032 n=1 Tax=Apium graveolens TaxID=4045 RepID=UPI003D7A2E23
MPLGLRNASAIFQRLINKMFKNQIGKTMKVYIDDMVVKTEKAENHVRDLQEAFDILKAFNMKLIPKKFTEHAVSGILVKENGGTQSPIYYVSKSLVEAETRYTLLEKLVLALEMTSTKLRHYFEWHRIHVMTNSPLRMVLSKPELTGRLAKWSIRLSTYDIFYNPRTTIKSQALADFVADFSPSQMTQAEKELQHIFSTTNVLPWTLYTDGASNVNGTGTELVLKSPQGDVLMYSVFCDFKTTNNEAEYEALIIELKTTRDMKIKNINIVCDSLLIVNHVNGTYEVKDQKMVTYLDIVRSVLHSASTKGTKCVSRRLGRIGCCLEGYQPSQCTNCTRNETS